MEEKNPLGQVSGGNQVPTNNTPPVTSSVVDPNAALNAPINVASNQPVLPPQPAPQQTASHQPQPVQPQVLPVQPQPTPQQVVSHQQPVQQASPQQQQQQSQGNNIELPSIELGSINNNAKNQSQPTANQVEQPVQPSPVPSQEEPKGQKAKRVFMILLFLLLFAFVFFLDDVTVFVQSFMNREPVIGVEDAESGRLRCSLSRTTEDLNLEVIANFRFEDRVVLTMEQETVHSGEVTRDAARITELREQCMYLRENTINVSGINVTCGAPSNSRTTMTENFNFRDINPSEIDAAYAEAGGTLPGFSINESISSVKEVMESAGFTCELVPES